MATTQTPPPERTQDPEWASRAARVLERPLRGAPAITAPMGARLSSLRSSAALTGIGRGLARWHPLVAVTLYVTGALVIQNHAVAHMATVIAGNIQGDPTQYMWAMWWWPHAILSGINPFVTHAVWVPNAYNTASITSTPTLALLFAPLNAIIGLNAGAVISYNLASLLAPVLSAFFTYRLLLHLTRAPAAAIAGGWLWGFGAYGLSQLQGHLQLVFTFFVPVVLWLALLRLDGVISRRRTIVLAAVAIIAEMGIGTEVLFTGTCMLGVVWITGLGLAPANRRRDVLSVGLELIGAYLAAAVLASPFLAYAVSGPAVEANSNSVLKMGDLLGFIIPTQLVRAGAVRFSAVSALFTEAGGVVENGIYLGVFLIGGALAYLAGTWRSWGTKVLGLSTGLAVIWTLGSTLTIAGQATVWLPWRLLEYQKPFNEVTPVRIGAWVSLGAVIAFSLWLARPGRWRWARWVVAALAAVMLFPNVDGSYPDGIPILRQGVASPGFITQGLYTRYLHPGEVILPIPFGPYGNSLLWQAQAHGYFRLASGWFGYIPPPYASTVAGQELMDFRNFDDPVGAMRRFIAQVHAGAAVVIPNEAGGWAKVFGQLGLHPVPAGGVDVYDIPAAMQGLGRR